MDLDHNSLIGHDSRMRLNKQSSELIDQETVSKTGQSVCHAASQLRVDRQSMLSSDNLSVHEIRPCVANQSIKPLGILPMLAS